MEQKKFYRQLLLAAALLLALHRPLMALLGSPQAISILIFTQTGRVVRPADIQKSLCTNIKNLLNFLNSAEMHSHKGLILRL